MKLIKKEKDSSNFQIGIGINFGSIFFNEGSPANIFGKTFELAASIAKAAKPYQILIDNVFLSKTKGKYFSDGSKIWKFKNSKHELRLISVIKEIR